MSLMLLAGVEQVWYVIALAAASGSFWAFQMTARHSYVYDIVGAENAMNGLALSAMNQRIGGVIGALFAGTFIAAWGLGNQYAVICVSLSRRRRSNADRAERGTGGARESRTRPEEPCGVRPSSAGEPHTAGHDVHDRDYGGLSGSPTRACCRCSRETSSGSARPGLELCPLCARAEVYSPWCFLPLSATSTERD